MGCKCCKDSDPKRYSECQSIIEKIKSMDSSQARGWRFRAPCGIPYTFGVTFFAKSKKEKRRMEILYYSIQSILVLLIIFALLWR